MPCIQTGSLRHRIGAKHTGNGARNYFHVPGELYLVANFVRQDAHCHPIIVQLHRQDLFRSLKAVCHCHLHGILGAHHRHHRRHGHHHHRRHHHNHHNSTSTSTSNINSHTTTATATSTARAPATATATGSQPQQQRPPNASTL